jgi:hypothetical protein
MIYYVGVRGESRGMGSHSAPVRVLVGDEDLDVHELVDDILHINFKDVAIDRAMDPNGIRTKIRAMELPYDLILLGDDGMKGLVEIVNEERPDLVKKTVMICPEESNHIEKWSDVPRILKPFSLDDFGEVLERICAA